MTAAPGRSAEFSSEKLRKSRIASALRSGCYWCLLALALWVPLPFGSARPWAWGVLATVVGLLVALLALSDLVSGLSGEQRLRSLALPGTLFSMAIAWAVVQCLPGMPAAWTHPIWQEAAKLLTDAPISSRISIDPAASRAAIVHLLSYAGVFWLSYRSCVDDSRARTVLTTIAGIGGIYAAWGLSVYWNGNRSVLWFDKWAYLDDLTSTFVNRNSYAAYTGLALVTASGLLFDAILRNADGGAGTTFRVRMRLLSVLLTARFVWIIATILFAATALLLTHSRGGMVATLAGILALSIAVISAPSFRGLRTVSLGTVAVILVGALWLLVISGTSTLTRLAETSWDVEGRHEINQLTLEAISDRPFLGTGLGTFKSVFAGYRTSSLPFLVDLAHNDYLENMLELGIPAALLLFGAVFTLLIDCVRGVFRRRHDAIIPCIGVGVTTLVGLHSLVDFSLQTPAVSVSYLLLLGAAVAQSMPSRARHGAMRLTSGNGGGSPSA